MALHSGKNTQSICDVTTPVDIHSQKDHRKQESLLGSSQRSYGSIGAAEDGRNPPHQIKTYRSRFWILTVFSLMNLVHDIEWIMWGPISESMEAAFAGWNPSIVSLTVNLSIIVYVITFIPICWAVQRYGVRVCLVMSFVLTTGGAALRCITSTTPAFTILCNLCAVTIGLASPVMLAGPPLIASEWFPVQERTTAMAIMVGSHQLGGIASYLEPLIVRQPGPGVSNEDIKHDVMRLTYIGAGLAAVLLVAVVAYFPSKPPSSPSVSSAEERFTILPALKTIVRNKKFLLLLVIYGIFAGPPIAWLTVIDYSLLPLGFHQNKAMWVGLISMVMSSLFPVLVGRFNDLVRGHTKTLLLVIMVISTVFFYWFLLLSYGVLPVTDWQVYLTVVGGVSWSYSSLPLFMELAIDLAYPAPELLVTGFVIGADCVMGAVFLLLFNIPDEKQLWVTYTLTLCSAIPVLPLAAVSFPSTRTDIDTR